MTWFAESANALEADKAHYRPFLAVDMDFSSGHARAWSGFGVLTIDSNSYLGMGEFCRASTTTDRTNLTYDRKTYQLSGAPVDPALVSEADIDASFGRSVIEYLGFMREDTNQILADPEVNFEGEISNIRRVDGRDPLIEVNAENRMVMLDQSDGWRFTHEHQQEFFAGDLGFDHVPKLALTEKLWGGRRVYPGSGGRAIGGYDDRIEPY